MNFISVIGFIVQKYDFLIEDYMIDAFFKINLHNVHLIIVLNSLYIIYHYAFIFIIINP